MHYRKLGRTGLVVSEIAMGCEGFFEEDCTMAKKLFDEAEKAGINYFDLYGFFVKFWGAKVSMHSWRGHALNTVRVLFRCVC